VKQYITQFHKVDELPIEKTNSCLPRTTEKWTL